MSPRMWIGGAALVASLGLNAYLLRGAPRDPKAAQARHAQTALPREPDPASKPSDHGCRAELERCHADGWKLLAKTLAAQAPRSDPSAAPDTPADRATPARQREALCEIAREHLRAHWESQKEAITRGVATDFADPNKQAAEARKTAAQMADALGLSPAQADGVAAEYQQIHADRVGRLRAALDRDAPDYEAVLGEVKGLYADEDAMIGRLRGDGAVQRWRVQELQGRTAILAIAATFAGDAWDDTIVW